MTRGRTSVRLLVTALLVPAALAVGACGGSSDDTAGPTTAPAADGASDPTTTTASGGESGNANGDFCERAKALEGNDDAIGAEAVAGYQNVLEVAPDEVRPDLEVVIEYFEAIDPAGADPAAVQKVAEMSQEYADASVRLVRYVNENC